MLPLNVVPVRSAAAIDHVIRIFVDIDLIASSRVGEFSTTGSDDGFTCMSKSVQISPRCHDAGSACSDTISMENLENAKRLLGNR